MTVDLRSRIDGHVRAPTDPAAFFDHDLPAAVDAADALLAPVLGWLDLRPLTVVVDDQAWHLTARTRVAVAPGAAASGAVVHLTAEQLADLATDQATFMGFFTHGTLDQRAGRLKHLLDWWLVLRSALDQRQIHTPGPLAFEAADGRALDLHHAFGPGDDPAEMRRFLTEAGYLHLAGVFGEAEMDAVRRDMDRAARDYAPDDGRSWWATTADGTERLVRMHDFEQRSEAIQRLLTDERFLAIGDIPGDGHQSRGNAQALVKPIGVVRGISDVPWHKDCSLGRHSYDCCSLTVGISVTGAGPRSGQLRVVAGSHRALVSPTFDHRETGLPEIDVPTRTGDVTVHLSCTKHMSRPPVERERRVVYTDFRLPPLDPAATDTTGAARTRLYRIMGSIPDGVSQRPSTVTAPG